MPLWEPQWSLETAPPEEVRRVRAQMYWAADELQRNDPGLSRAEALDAAADLVVRVWHTLGPQGWEKGRPYADED